MRSKKEKDWFEFLKLFLHHILETKRENSQIGKEIDMIEINKEISNLLKEITLFFIEKIYENGTK